MRRCDIAVVGGGPAGAIVARLLAAWGYEVVLLECSPAPRRKPGEAIAPAARMVLEKLGLRSDLDARPELAAACHGVVSDWAGPHRRDFLRDPSGHGWIIDRRRFEKELAERASTSGADWRWGHRLVAATRSASTDRLELTAERPDRSRENISARFGIDATGRVAALARRLGAKRRIATRHIAYESMPTMRMAGPGPGWLAIQARAHGWDYLSQGPGGHIQGFSFGAACAHRPPGARAWEAGFSILDRCAGIGWIAVGDAAAAFDPLTSQGINHALGSGMAAAHATHAIFDGAPAAADAYAQAVIRTWSRSLASTVTVYGSEKRWHDCDFWQTARRQPENSQYVGRGGTS